jgi:hypothetical protein
MVVNVIFCLTMVAGAMAQKQYERMRSIANAHFAVREYSSAITYYKKCIKIAGDRDSIVYQLALCYVYSHQNKEAKKAYQYLLQQHPTQDTLHFTYAEALRRTGQYSEARKQYQLFFLKSRNPSHIKTLISACDSALKWIKQSPSWKVENVLALNTAFSELSPIISQHRMIFASNREETLIRKKNGLSGAPSYDLYTSEKNKDSSWKEPRLFSAALNTPNDETSVSTTLHGQKMYFTRTKTDKDNAVRIKLFSAEKKGVTWGDERGFIFNDSLSSFAQPCVDEEDKLLFFVSNMPGGYGGTDIYVCVNVEGKWSDPINMGEIINTKGNETYPFYDSKEQKLYFSSDGHLGMGGQDLFFAEQKNGEWTNVFNLKYPVNSPADDVGIWIDSQDLGYFSSNREGGKGKEDLYRMYRSKK